MISRSFAVALAGVFAFAALPAFAQDKAPPKAPAAAPAAPKSTVGAMPSTKELYPKPYFDLLLKERMASGQPDSPEMRAAIRDELNTRELLVREAKKKGMDKTPEVKTQTDLMGQTVLVRYFVSDWMKSNPVSDDLLKKDYEMVKSQMGDKEYKVRHILVDKEDEAKAIIASLQKGDKFEDLAKQSKDPGSKDRGGDLDWNAPGNFVKPFSDAMVKLEKGKFTTVPVQTQFGWHVIRVDDVREAKVPPFEEVKPRLQQQVQAQQFEAYLRDLRSKNGLQ